MGFSLYQQLKKTAMNKYTDNACSLEVDDESLTEKYMGRPDKQW